ncbi:copper resistance protein CopC [Paenibacillus sp. 2TAB23]|uniref:copper resistance protein CopC n=1 Tax=Paenibacillus sp. 2TAB23 TaxID=3233004 RepID=UPI003F9AF360
MKRALKCIMVLMVMWACLPSLVSAHAYIAQSTPYSDAELTAAPPAIRLTFTEKIDTKLSNVTLKRIDNGAETAGVLSGDEDITLIYTIPKLNDGIYEVSWQVLSLDSHITDGSFQFAVGTKLAHTKPDDTVSLDGGGKGSTDTGSADSPAATVKPTSTVKPKPTAKPSSTPKPTAAISPSAAPQETVATTAAPVETETVATTAVPVETETAASSPEATELPAVLDDGGEGSGKAGVGNASTPTADESSDSEAAAETPPLKEAASGSSEHNGSSHAEAGEHEHKGGHGSMVALRVLDILTSVLLLGILFFRYAMWREDEAKPPFGFSLHAERIVTAAAVFVWIITGLTRLSMLSEQFGGISLYALATGSMIGKVAILRPALALLLLLLAFAPSKERIWANPVKFVAAAALIASFPLTGHAYASLVGASTAIVAHVFHMAAAAVWFGGLAGLFAMTFEKKAAERLNEAAVRFSSWALPSMLLVLLSGIWLASARLSAWGELFSTAYGKLIVAKIGLMLLVLVIAALHMFVFMPRISKADARRGLLLGIRAEVLLAVALFVAAGWLSSTSPPAESASALSEPIYWHVMGDKAHMSMRISDSEQSKEQSARLDVWLPEGQDAPVSAKAVVTVDGISGQLPMPLALQPLEEELFEYPGYTKYTYRAAGAFIKSNQNSLIQIDIEDGEGNKFHYERSFGDEHQHP